MGKTSVITQLLYDQFRENHQRTLQDMYCGVFDLCGEKMILDIEDTSGSFAQDFPAMLEVSLASADAVLLVYDVTEEETFEEISKLKDLIKSMENIGNLPIVVFANKTDKKWSLPAIEATVLLDWECAYVEGSALDRESMDKMVAEVLNQARKEGRINIPYDVTKSRDCLIRRKAFPEIISTHKQEKRKQKKKHSCSIS